MIFSSNFDEQEYFDPINSDKIDIKRLERYTSWNREDGPTLDFVSTDNSPHQEAKEDRIDLLFSAVLWQYREPEVHIGIYLSN